MEVRDVGAVTDPVHCTVCDTVVLEPEAPDTLAPWNPGPACGEVGHEPFDPVRAQRVDDTRALIRIRWSEGCHKGHKKLELVDEDPQVESEVANPAA